MKVLTHRKKKKDKEGQRERERERGRGKENGSGRVGGAGGGERERTLPGVSFFLSAIINGILPLTHSSLRQTKDPAFQCSLTGQPASQLSHIALTH